MSYLENDGVPTMGVTEPGDPGLAYSAHARSLVGHAPKVGAVKRRKLLNYPGPDFLHMTKEEWRRLPRNCKGSWLEGIDVPGHAAHRVRVAVVHSASLSPVYIVDAVRIDPSWPSVRGPRVPGCAACQEISS